MMQDTDKNQFYVTQDFDAYTDSVDNLMDDLFGEVESTLHVDYAKQRSPKAQKTQKQFDPYASKKASSSDIVALSKIEPENRDVATSKDTVNITKLDLADISLPPISKQDVLWIQPYIMRDLEPPSNIPPTPPESVVQKNNLLDRILLVAACSSALLAAVMWTINHGIWLGRQSVTVIPTNSKISPDNKPFADEIKRMLSDITDKNRAITANSNGNIGSNLPLMASPLVGNMPLSVAPNPFANGNQPMYVPVYQPPNLASSNTSNVPSPLALPPLTANNSIDASNPSAIAKPNSTFTQAAAPMPSYTLIGVLDLGDRSTAMFDMNGSVQSVGLGKVIGNTGWTLARVSQQEVVAKRGKETKTIFVGQKF
ncbi:MAG: hypothetical protein IM537_12010 [Pseudanabaena sp. M57BS1SP1A06MG]|nr:hypothetical protein [Pseudanabaena sp. M53BS1SP1A06MG]MCA6583182.1 hypothetical protein [Pseudanabaena sp. M34BS1SP1A06MG]MCA6594293.1 hypothetical protein [Pseudanabaena sp. M38BS1SP1A06MG]MCA6600900.1 hypothetical protein [Pseudanabaena sp. M57BS1SP1A06MG]